ncbi:AAA family ATPase [Thermoactinomyces sp. DSM 45892]|uniref:AAA family ATPase n=1 Tax=Thermoactinomyces sp. DSM 45892 TaxID=1882753 RepID=UPI0008959EBA|nr:AAA family ATPase [Thermoactinomyces sp. DSM 45892]SDX94879.1 ATP-dependent DNA helicase, RecD/TraA family [Thermoactinomyces sp. DSM 45892]
MSNRIIVIPNKKLYFDEKNYYGIFACQVHSRSANKITLNKYGTISIKGTMPQLKLGEKYCVSLKEDPNGKYQGSYIVLNLTQLLPQSKEEQKLFFKSFLPSAQLNHIFEIYNGEDIISLIKEDKFDYRKIKGMEKKAFETIYTKVNEILTINEISTFIHRNGIPYHLVADIFKKYTNTETVIDLIENNPYLLTGVIGFPKADEIAKSMGHSLTSPLRIEACIKYVIQEESVKGHTWIDYDTLLNRCATYLSIDRSYIDTLLTEGTPDIVKKRNRYTLREFYKQEELIAMKMNQIKTQSKQIFTPKEIDAFLDNYCTSHRIILDHHQRKFFHDWNNNNILFLIGGGGMGKSWIQRILLELVKKKNLTVALLAPTGKASKVMSHYTGEQASTIHRKIRASKFLEKATGKIKEDIIIVDESSMCDIFILAQLFDSIDNPNVRILFVGDDFQLPSIGAGNFFYDAIHSHCITASKLEKFFRQEDDGILNVATHVRNGTNFLKDHSKGQISFGNDCLFHLVDPPYIQNRYLQHYSKLLEQYAPEDTVILSPTKKGILGTAIINQEIQNLVNPASPMKKEIAFGKSSTTRFRVDDLVMNIVNSYEMEAIGGEKCEVLNGDTGKIVDILKDEKVIIVDFDGVEVKVKFSNVLKHLVHSWALTIHKSQGSQYKAVIVILDESMAYQLNANLIYTAFSRAKNQLLVLGQAKTINHGVSRFASLERRSFLPELLHQFSKPHKHSDRNIHTA